MALPKAGRQANQALLNAAKENDRSGAKALAQAHGRWASREPVRDRKGAGIRC